MVVQWYSTQLIDSLSVSVIDSVSSHYMSSVHVTAHKNVMWLNSCNTFITKPFHFNNLKLSSSDLKMSSVTLIHFAVLCFQRWCGRGHSLAGRLHKEKQYRAATHSERDHLINVQLTCL